MIDPATGQQIALVPDANQEDVNAAVAAARAAFERGAWRDMKPAQREALLWRLSDLIEKHTEQLAELESMNNGKTKLMATLIDVNGTRDYFRYMAGWATKIMGDTFQISSGAPHQQFHTFSLREPVGVVAQIVPWNFPLAMAAWKLGPGARRGLHLRAEARRADAAHGTASR